VGLTTDKNNPELNEVGDYGQNKIYLVLSDEELGKGFIRPVRRKYTHVGIKPKFPTRELTEEEHERYDKFGYILFEVYPESETSAVTGRFWTKEQLNSGCGAETIMNQTIAETYARDPKFYGSTFCVNCGKHLPVEEFEWRDGAKVGS